VAEPLGRYATTTLLASSKGRLIRCTVPGLTPNRSAILRTPSVRPGLSRAARIAFSVSAGIVTAEPLALALGPRQPGTNALLDDRALELGKDAHHLKHRLAGRGRGVEALLMQEQIDPQGVQFGEKADQVLEAAAQSIDRPSHHHVELPLGGVPA
jgi:hypothetical protein